MNKKKIVSFTKIFSNIPFARLNMRADSYTRSNTSFLVELGLGVTRGKQGEKMEI